MGKGVDQTAQKEGMAKRQRDKAEKEERDAAKVALKAAGEAKEAKEKAKQEREDKKKAKEAAKAAGGGKKEDPAAKLKALEMVRLFPPGCGGSRGRWRGQGQHTQKRRQGARRNGCEEPQKGQA